MKILMVCFATLVLIQSCKTKSAQGEQFASLIRGSDELTIIFYGKNAFAYKTTDTSAINLFAKLISHEDEKLNDTCEPTGQLIFKRRGQELFHAELTTQNTKEISCEYVTYFVNNKRYRHRLTYRHGMSIDGIYWHKVDPQGNPWPGADTTKFLYEEIKNNR